eukprot:TRINITY_DN8290_c2_g1_i1.p1 TRINITY_DN8290_c2_g1~~TRINITY_DN8290_c2_g1_i1.p1  ORF type:complete len:198 (+),score=45.72 TRINITY_DN8290_c2_g1_i1:36-629(+)
MGNKNEKNVKVVDIKGKNKNNTEFKIVLLGEGGVGKTCLMNRYISGFYLEEYDPTCEISCRKREELDEKVYGIDVLDTHGQEDYSALRDQFIRSGDMAVVVFDLTRSATFDECEKYIQQYGKIKNNNEELNDINFIKTLPLMLVGTKLDLEERREVHKEDALKLAKKYGCEYKETSAKSDINVNQVFLDSLKLLTKN